MSGKTQRIRVEFGPFSVVLEGFENSAEGIDMAVQLMRDLSSSKLLPGTADLSLPAPEASGSPQSTDGTPPAKPLLLRQEPSGGQEAEQPEFHTMRLDASELSNMEDPSEWLSHIRQLANSARNAVDTLSHGDPEMPDAAPSEEANDRFSPRSVANADIRPEDGAPDAERDSTIREKMEINRLAIEQAAADGSAPHERQNTDSQNYLAMEDKAIDRLLETTNALMEKDDHTRKSQSLGRLKAAVVATEAERRISVKTATGTVTLDFEEKGTTRQPVTDLLASSAVDPEKRRQRLQDYRKMIAEHKKRQ